MARPAAATSEERTFRIDELFFSTTDRHGKILAGNGVFARVSGWSAAELIGEPHNILRHPDMPRVVFKLLWDEISAGRPIVAYVKNRARNGAYYWVIASVVPVRAGYLSVRFKPSSALFPVVQGVYQQLRAIEKAIEDGGGSKEDAMTASARALSAALAGLGFASYRDFMLAFVPEEVRSRDAVLAREPARAAAAGSAGALGHMREDIDAIGAFLDGEFRQLGDFIALGQLLVKKATFVSELAASIRLISQNVSIAARRRETAGRPLAVVGDTIRELSDQVRVVTVGLADQISRLSADLTLQAFRISIGRLQAQTAQAFIRDVAAGDGASVGAVSENVGALVQCLDADARALVEVYRDLGGLVRGAGVAANQMAASLGTLSMVRMTGRVEVSRLKDNEQFASLFITIEKELASATSELDELTKALQTIEAATKRALEGEADVIVRLARVVDAAGRLGATSA